MATIGLSPIDKFFNTLDQKLEKRVQNHLRSVYGCLAACLLAAAAGAYVHLFTSFLQDSFYSLFGSLIMMALIFATPQRPDTVSRRFAYLLGFAAFTGLSTGPLLAIVIRINPALIATAFFGTSTVFACFSLASLYAPDGKLLYLGGTLLSVCSTLFWMALFNLFFGSYFVYQVNLYLGLMLMCGFVLYDTQSIIEKCRMGDTDYVYHSMNLFIDFVGMFTRLLIILTQKEDRKKKSRD